MRITIHKYYSKSIHKEIILIFLNVIHVNQSVSGLINNNSQYTCKLDVNTPDVINTI